MVYGMAAWVYRMAMQHGPFMDDLPIKTCNASWQIGKIIHIKHYSSITYGE